MHAAYNMARAVALVIACVSHGCGPVVATAPESPVKASARRAVAAALRAALAEACHATLPPVGAHPLHVIAHAMACGHHPMPAAGVSLPLPPPPASPAEVL
jgi:hypothetical protein